MVVLMFFIKFFVLFEDEFVGWMVDEGIYCEWLC